MTKKKKDDQTTPEEFEWFKMECTYWVKKFGITQWQIFFQHAESKADKDFAAWAITNYTNRSVVLGLGLDYHDSGEREFNISRDAFHEVCELLLNDVVVIAKMDISQMQLDELTKSTHEVIRVLENTVWEPDYWRRKKETK